MDLSRQRLLDSGFHPEAVARAVRDNQVDALFAAGAGMRENLHRDAPFTLVRAEENGDDDGLTIEGYGAVFNSVTRIDSWEGTFDERIALGAFRKSLRERMPKMQFDHGSHPLLGSLPLGGWTTAEEDQRGLHLAGRLDDNWLIQPFRDSILNRRVDGMSFRFSVVREEWRDKDGKLVKPDELLGLLWDPGDRGPLLRTLKEVKVPEVGPVVWPAYEATSVDVRSVTIDLGRIGEPGERKKLAELLARAMETDRASDAPPTNQETPDEHPAETTESPDAPPADDSSPGEHPSSSPAPEDDHALSEDERQLRQMLAEVRTAREVSIT